MTRSSRPNPSAPFVPPRRPRGGVWPWVWRYLAFLAVVAVVLALLVNAPPDWFDAVRAWLGQNVAFVLVAALIMWSVIMLTVRLRRRKRRPAPVRR